MFENFMHFYEYLKAILSWYLDLNSQIIVLLKNQVSISSLNFATYKNNEISTKNFWKSLLIFNLILFKQYNTKLK